MEKREISAFLKLILFWLVTFWIFRILFVILFGGFDASLASSFFYKSLLFDLAVSVPLSSIQFLLLSFFSTKSIHKIIIVCLNFILCVDISLYAFWQCKFNIKALFYLKTPYEIIHFLSNIQLFGFVIGLVLICIISIYVFHRWIYTSNLSLKITFKTVLFGLLFIAINIISIRGGISQIPLNQSFAFISKNNNTNYAILNSVWNVGNVLFDNFFETDLDSYKILNPEDANMITNNLHKTSDTTTENPFLFQEKPNVLIILMEGVNKVCVPTYMPFLHKKIEEGLYFDNAFANGFRTEQGISSLISGEYPLPFKNTIENVNLVSEIPSLIRDLKKEGYTTSFYFGGESEFGKIKSYFVQNEIDNITDIHNFNSHQKTQKLGVEDSFLFQELISNIQSEKKPFFKIVLTQSTHQPYDIKGYKSSNSEKDNYLNAVSYLDRQLKQFFKNAEKSKLLKNTLVIITSDHSHFLPDYYKNEQKEFFNIPFLILSDKLKPNFKGKKESKLYSQVDFPATLHFWLQSKNQGDYLFSKNYYSTYSQPFCFTSFIDGFNWIEPNKITHYDYRYPILDKDKFEPAHIKSMAIMQVLAERYRGNIKNKRNK